MPNQCTDLRDLAGVRYKVHNELEGRRAHARDDLWDLIVPGWSGFVAPWGAETLVACTQGMATTRAILAAAPGAVVVQDGSDGQNVTFHPLHFDTVARLLRLCRRRRLTEAQRQAAALRLAGHSFQPVESRT